MFDYDLTTPSGRAAWLMAEQYAHLVRSAPGPYPSALSRSTAEDAVQEVLHAVARGSAPAPVVPDELLAWTVVAVRRTNARMVRRQRGLERLTTAETDGLPASALDDPVHALVERRESLDRVRRSLHDLDDPRDRQIAALHLLEYGRDEIARLAECSPARARRVVERFRHELG